MSNVPEPKSESGQVEVWQTLQEAEWRAKDRDLQEKLAGTPWYKNALIIGIMVTAITIGGNLVVSVINHTNSLITEQLKAEGQRVLQAIEADTSDQAAVNLQLLRDARLITGDLDRNIGEYLANRRPGEGAVIGIPRSDFIEPGLTLEFGEGAAVAALLVAHNNERTGAYSPFLESSEFDVSFALSIEIAREIGNRTGKALVLTRPTGDSIGFDQQISRVAERLDEVAPKIGLEIHFNVAESDLVRGTEVFFGESASPALRELAEEIGSTASSIMGTHFRGSRPISLSDRGGYIANRPNTHTLVVELFFGTNLQDSENFRVNRIQIVKALAEILTRWSG